MRLLALGMIAFTTMACTEGDEDEGEEGGVASDARCASGLRWAGGNEESPLMHPGADCIGCHRAEGEGPRFVIAGTVHAAFDEPADCFGVEGVGVSVTDANGMVVDLVTNAAGNFYTQASLAMPIQARLSFEGRERLMTFTPAVGACATCHTQTGASNAPGRILAP